MIVETAAAPSDFASFLRTRRESIPPDTGTLGSWKRLPARRGRRITQEEIAEAVGISRNWYRRLESGDAPRASAKLLNRLASVLGINSIERSSLFELAIPELSTAKLQSRSNAMLEAFTWIRSLTRRLWAASTEEEALTVVREYLQTQLGPRMSMSTVRGAQGGWNMVVTGDEGASRGLERLYSFKKANWHPGLVDDMHAYPIFTQPGEVATYSEILPTSAELAALYPKVLDEFGYRDMDYIFANVQSRRGLVARLAVIYGTRHFFSENERAVISTLADLTSFALSDAAPH